MENLTLEFRSADGSADAHLLHAALAVAARHGLEMAEALAVAARLRVDVNVFRPEAKGVRDRLPVLPSACEESADALLGKRAVFEQDGVFPRSVIEGVATRLKRHAEEDALCRTGDPEALEKLVAGYLHCP
jgi:glutamine synthetase